MPRPLRLASLPVGARGTPFQLRQYGSTESPIGQSRTTVESQRGKSRGERAAVLGFEKVLCRLNDPDVPPIAYQYVGLGERLDFTNRTELDEQLTVIVAS